MSRTQVGTRLLGAGSVLQVVRLDSATQVTTTTQCGVASPPANTEGVQWGTVTITPKFSTSRLDIFFHAPFTCASHGEGPVVALFRDSTVSSIAVSFFNLNATDSGAYRCDVTLAHSLTAGSTAATTFKIRFGPNGSASTVFSDAGYGAFATSSLVVTEIAA